MHFDTKDACRLGLPGCLFWGKKWSLSGIFFTKLVSSRACFCEILVSKYVINFSYGPIKGMFFSPNGPIKAILYVVSQKWSH